MSVFVSFDSRDENFANELLRNLTALGIPVWNPAVKLLPGSNWLLETGRALERADAVILVVSSNWGASKWARLDMQYALSNHRLEGRVFPVILGSGMADAPWILRHLVGIKAGNRKASEIAQEIAEGLKKSIRGRRSNKVTVVGKKKAGSRRTASAKSRTARSR